MQVHPLSAESEKVRIELVTVVPVLKIVVSVYVVAGNVVYTQSVALGLGWTIFWLVKLPLVPLITVEFADPARVAEGIALSNGRLATAF